MTCLILRFNFLIDSNQKTYLQIQTKFACVTMMVLLIVGTYTYCTSAVPGKQFNVTVSPVGNMNRSSEGTIIVHFINTKASTLVNTSA